LSTAPLANRDSRPLTVGVFGHYGNENLGDEAIIEAVIQAVRARFPHSRIYGFSINPGDTAQRYDIEAFPIRNFAGRDTSSESVLSSDSEQPMFSVSVRNDRSRVRALKEIVKRVPFVGAVLRFVRSSIDIPGDVVREFRFLWASGVRLKQVDLLLISGSNQFLDNFGGVWGFPYTLLKWSVLAKLARAKLAFLSVGAGPIDSPISRVFVRMALRLADYASYRDRASKELIERAGRQFGEVYPDLAHGLFFESQEASSGVAGDRAKRLVVGINPMPVYDHRYWHAPDGDRYQEYVDRLAKLADMLIRDEFDVFFFPTQKRDESVISDVLSRLGEMGCPNVDSRILMRSTKSVSGLLEIYAQADIVVATRFHGVLLALRAGRPVLGICYFRKTRDLLRDVGQEACAVELENFTPADLFERLKSLASRYETARGEVCRRSEEYRSALQSQYAQVFQLVEDSR